MYGGGQKIKSSDTIEINESIPEQVLLFVLGFWPTGRKIKGGEGRAGFAFRKSSYRYIFSTHQNGLGTVQPLP